MMKKALQFVCIASSLFIPVISFAQIRGSTTINLGAGYSYFLSQVNISALGGQASTVTNSSTPVLNGTLDYGYSHKITIGIGAAYQSATIHYMDYLNSTSGQQENFDEKLTRMNAGVRLLLHFSQEPKLDAYTGPRVGVSLWQDQNNADDPNFVAAKGSVVLPSFQWLVGLRGYVSSAFGLHLEFGIGTPYLVEGGITIKFGGTAGDGFHGRN